MSKIFNNNGLNEEFDDIIDSVNDRITDLTDSVISYDNLQSVMQNIDAVLAESNMRLDHEDIEDLFGDDWEEPSGDEAVNFLMPVYHTDNSQSELNLSVTIALNDFDTVFGYILDAELQYDWESDDELETEYMDFDGQGLD